MTEQKPAPYSSWAEVRSYIARAGTVSSFDSGELTVTVKAPGDRAEKLVEFLGGSPQDWGAEELVWRGVSALDLLGHLYELNDAPGLERLGGAAREQAELYRRWCSRMAHIAPSGGPQVEVRIRRLEEAAVLPSKERVSDSGYDVTLIAVRKVLGQVTLFGTGLVVEPPQGWYFDVVPRSSIIKRGYVLANSVGVIDRAYRGELMVPLIKVDPAAPDLELPVRLAQLVPRPIAHFPVREISQVEKTHRGEGGFGSSG